ncbi:hypothetical protein FDB55_06825 [Clostridium botulinum]|uniref:hypothetical protein n=1 Tax=Clostridium botulinum TaxID=1491 RepID=UPI0013F019B2|nr:hypothetical protein [Clostridium botulinum]MCS6110386.1 hypothetical protein [Clostridium botulinum]NFE13127.1 hypothetical protein [Clostridium botulinum]NFL42219.1 hypothetical protein [Clostridium botulinum]NFN21452.1 hypothetical protein [Clostridium botulinum]NFN42663.1 hypothetical protein [Clostridium botulinum]
MCKYCQGEYGKTFKIEQSSDNAESMTEGFISNTEDDEVAGIVLLKHGATFGVFNTLYCPFCGRKLRS